MPIRGERFRLWRDVWLFRPGYDLVDLSKDTVDLITAGCSENTAGVSGLKQITESRSPKTKHTAVLLYGLPQERLRLPAAVDKMRYYHGQTKRREISSFSRPRS